MRRLLMASTIAICCGTLLLEGQEGAVTWFKFDEHFIEARYPAAVAFGRLTIDAQWKMSGWHVGRVG